MAKQVGQLPSNTGGDSEQWVCGRCGAKTTVFRWHDGNYYNHDNPKPTRDRCSRCITLEKAWERLCPPLYQQHDEAKYPKASAPKLAAVLKWQYGPRGLLLYGDTGTGKTRAAWRLLHRLHFDDGKWIMAFNAVSFAHEVATAFGSGGDPDGWDAGIRNAGIVFLDDLGKCRLTERGMAELFGLVETRAANLKPIIVTTNGVGKTLEEEFGGGDAGAALVRRLREFCECIGF